MNQSYFTSKYRELVDEYETQEQASHALDLSQSFVSLLVNGKKFMSPKTALSVEKATNGKFKAIDLCFDMWAYHRSTQPQDNPALEDAS